MEAFAQKNIYEQTKDKTEAKYKELQIDLQKIMSGKSTLGSFFQNKEEKITTLEKQISNVF